MNKVNPNQHNTSELTTSDDHRLSWKEVKNRELKDVTITEWFLLLFKPWKTVTAPKGTPCYITNFYEQPLYQYKILDGICYYIEPKPGPGFPGS